MWQAEVATLLYQAEEIAGFNMGRGGKRWCLDFTMQPD
jgi:hypothetical protein